MQAFVFADKFIRAVETCETVFGCAALVEAFSLDTEGPFGTLSESAIVHTILTIANKSHRALGVKCTNRIARAIFTDGSSDTPHQGTPVSAFGVETEPAGQAISM